MSKELLALMAFNIENGTAKAPDAEKALESRLPEGWTLDDIKQSNEIQREFHADVTEAVLPEMVEAIKSDTKLGLLALELNACDRDYGVVLTRPTAESPTEQQYRDGIAVYSSDRVSDSIKGCVDRAAALWSN